MNGVFGSKDLVGGVPQSVFCCSAEGGSVVSLNVCNRGNLTTYIDVAVSTSMNSPAASEWIEYGVELLPKGVLERTGITVSQGQFVTVRSSRSNVSAMCWGISTGSDVDVPTITANPDTSVPVWQSSATLPDVYAGFNNSIQLSATDPGDLTYSVTSGSLPTGLQLGVKSGVISGYMPAETYGSNTTLTPTITVSDGTNSVPRVFSITRKWRDGSTAASAAPNAAYIKNLTGTTSNGFYWLTPNPDLYQPIRLYCDMNYSGGGWTLVMANTRRGSFAGTPSDNGIGALQYMQVVNDNNQVGTVDTNLQFRTFVGVQYWTGLGLNVAQFCSTACVTLNSTGSHTKRYRWRYTGFNSTYGFQGATGVSDETGTGAPGMLTYHAITGYSLTAYDRDQDVSGGNCATSYGNTPFWYGACWDGNFWGGGNSGSYADAPHWAGSGGDNHNYMALYLKV